MKLYKILAVTAAVLITITVATACVNGGTADGGDSAYSGAPQIQNVNVEIKTVDASSRGEDEPYSSARLKTVIAEIRPSVVEVIASSVSASDETITVRGSGVVIASGEIAPDGQGGETSALGIEAPEVISYIATCYHIVEKASNITVVDIYGKEYSAKPVGADDRTDICVLSVKEELPAATFLSDSSALGVGEGVIAAANPLGTPGGTVTKGIISAVNDDILVNNVMIDLYQTDAATSGASSGGGLFSDDGYFLGLINDSYADYIDETVAGISFVTPAKTVSAVSKELMETYTGETLGYIRGRYLLGCKVANHYTSYWQSTSYVVISALDRAGSFYKGGLREGDQLVSVSFNGVQTAVTTAVKFSEYLDSLDLSVGDELIFNIKRNENGNVYSYTLPVTVLQYVCGAE